MSMCYSLALRLRAYSAITQAELSRTSAAHRFAAPVQYCMHMMNLCATTFCNCHFARSRPLFTALWSSCIALHSPRAPPQRREQVLSPPAATTALCIFQAPDAEFGWKVAIGYDTGIGSFALSVMFAPCSHQHIPVNPHVTPQVYSASCKGTLTPSYTTCSGSLCSQLKSESILFFIWF